MPNETLKKCLFCGKSENKVKNMFSAGNAHICEECVIYCYDVLAEQEGLPVARPKPQANKSSKSRSGIDLKKPSEIKAVLDEYVIGQ